MKNRWRAMAAGLAMLIGISGAAFGQPRQQQPVSNMRTAEYRAPQRAPEPQRPSQNQPVQQPQRTQAPPQRPGNDHNWNASGQDHRMPVPVNRPVVNGYNGDRNHGRPDGDHGWPNGGYVRPVVVVQHPIYTRPVYIAPAYVYYDAGYGVPVDYVTTPQQAGFQDGLADGHNDWVMGFGFRNGFDNDYVNADNGFGPDFGSLQAYQVAYRVAYQQGYTQGYGR